MRRYLSADGDVTVDDDDVTVDDDDVTVDDGDVTVDDDDLTVAVADLGGYPRYPWIPPFDRTRQRIAQ